MSSLPQISSLKAPDKAVANATRPTRCKYLYPPLLIVLALLVPYGLLIVYTAVQGDADYNFNKQLLGVCLGVVAMAIIWRFDYRNLSEYTTVLLVINMALILSPHIPGLGTDAGMGATSWIKIGMQVQPGEFAKFTVILLAASVVAKYGGKLDDAREYVKALGIMLVPFICIMTQPDLGTGLVYLTIAAVALVMGGARPKFLLITLGVCVLAVVAIFLIDQLIYNSLGEYKLVKQYQRNRLLVFLETDSVSLSDEGWNLKQAQVAIGSGGLFGKGLFNATQATLGYLPEAPTDFIFCVLAEQLGFVGVCVLLVLYAALVAVCFRIASEAGDLFGAIIVMCITGMWLFQILENMGMTLGLMPITGIPLPFMSYGSSFMLVNFMLLGLIGSVQSHSNRVVA